MDTKQRMISTLLSVTLVLGATPVMTFADTNVENEPTTEVAQTIDQQVEIVAGTEEAAVEESNEEVTPKAENQVKKSPSKAQTFSAMNSTSVAIDEAHFPDEIFRDQIIRKFDTDGDGSLSAAEINNATKVHVNAMSIRNYAGIEYLTNLQDLTIINHSSGKLDLSKNTELRTLKLFNNGFTSVDVSKLKKLQVLHVYENELTTLDISNCPELEELYCAYNNLTSLDISKNTKLRSLRCGDNKITSIDASKNTKLEELFASRNDLTKLTVGNNPKLAQMIISENPKLASIDIRGLSGLTHLWARDTGFTSLDVTQNMKLYLLSIDDTNISKIDLSKNTELVTFGARNAKLTTLDLKNNKNLKSVNTDGNQFANFRPKANADTWTSVRLTWTAPPYATSYEIYVEDGNSLKKLGSTTSKSFTAKNVKAGVSATYHVNLCVNGNSVRTYKIKATPISKAPTTKIKTGKHYVKVSWSKKTGSTGYQIARATSKNGKYKVVKTTKSSSAGSYKTKAKKKGKSYYYKVRAYKKVNGKTYYSAWSTVRGGKTK